jgi:hypothetical protein
MANNNSNNNNSNNNNNNNDERARTSRFNGPVVGQTRLRGEIGAKAMLLFTTVRDANVSLVNNRNSNGTAAA